MSACENLPASVRKLEDGLGARSEGGKETTTSRPLLSIITVCLNSEMHLEQTIKSVIGQTYDNIEYIVIDGGSSDGTVDIIRKYDFFISHWVSEPDLGIYDAMNKGIEMSKGDLVGLLNSDDWYTTRAIEWVVTESLVKPDSDVFHGDCVFVGDGEKYRRIAPRGKDVVDNLQICIHHPTFFVRSEIYREYKYDCRYVNADRDFIMKLYFNGKKFSYVNRPLTHFRNAGISNRPSFRFVLDRYRIRSRYNRGKAMRFFIKDLILFFDEVAFSYKKAWKMKNS